MAQEQDRAHPTADEQHKHKQADQDAPYAQAPLRWQCGRRIEFGCGQFMYRHTRPLPILMFSHRKIILFRQATRLWQRRQTSFLPGLLPRVDRQRPLLGISLVSEARLTHRSLPGLVSLLESTRLADRPLIALISLRRLAGWSLVTLRREARRVHRTMSGLISLWREARLARWP